jgi:hypothetical protein
MPETYPRPSQAASSTRFRSLRRSWTRLLLTLFALLTIGWPSLVRGEDASSEEAYSYSLIDAEMAQWVVTSGQVEVHSEDSEPTDDKPDALAGSPILRLVEGQGLLRSVHQFRDFELELEWRPLGESSWESGIFFRSNLPEENSPWPSRYRISLKEGEAGRLIGLSDVNPQVQLNARDWNRFQLRVVGGHAELTINGQSAWSTDEIESADGFIGLQINVPEGGSFEFRNIRVTELGFRSLFNGKDLTGWEGATQPASSCWKVEDELLVCTGERGTWLRTQEQFGDFNLRFEYRLLAGGNSGIYVRVPEDGNHHGDGAGVEIQLLDDHAERYRDLKPYQYCGSVYAIVPADPRVSRPAGRWNSMEIECRGTSYRVVHNGIEVIRADVDDYPELAGRLVHGYLGLQNHNEEVWFRNLRVAPAR